MPKTLDWIADSRNPSKRGRFSCWSYGFDRGEVAVAIVPRAQQIDGKRMIYIPKEFVLEIVSKDETARKKRDLERLRNDAISEQKVDASRAYLVKDTQRKPNGATKLGCAAARFQVISSPVGFC